MIPVRMQCECKTTVASGTATLRFCRTRRGWSSVLHRTRSVLGLTRVVACGWTDHARRASSSRAPGHDGLRTRPHTSPTPRNMREHAARLFITSSAACAVMIIGIAVPTTIFAQRGGFVTTLGTDTVQVEQFVRRDRAITGVLVTRTPFVKMTRYEIRLDDRDRLASYAQQVTDGLGASLTPDPGPASLIVTGDTIRRTARARDGTVVTQAIAAPDGAYPVGTIPIGASFAVFELAIAPLLYQALSSRPTLGRLLPTAVQSAPSYTPVLFIAKDSVEVDYFGQGRFGFRFDNQRRLLRSDWRHTTYDVRVTRVDTLDVADRARRWYSAQRAGEDPGAVSPRDSLVFRAGAASVAIRYGRPAKRGREIWGGLVPEDRVWRLGADFATQLVTDRDLQIGDHRVPAGEYTLWMQPSASDPRLIVSSLVRVFGTQYDARKDLLRVPMTRSATTQTIERLTLGWQDGQLCVVWDRQRFCVAVDAASPDILR